MINSLEILKRIVYANKIIENLSFYEFGKYELVQNRIKFIKPLDVIFDSALALRDTYNLPFWDSFNLSLFNKSFENYNFLKEINFHNNPIKKIQIKRDDFLKSNIDFHNYTTICSLVNSESDHHIPLFDFHIPPSNNNQKLCVNIIKHLELTGYLLDSGKSYHFIGNKIISYKDLQEILFNALLFAPIIDKSWIAHQLIQKYCCLRVSKKYERLPILVDEI